MATGGGLGGGMATGGGLGGGMAEKDGGRASSARDTDELNGSVGTYPS